MESLKDADIVDDVSETSEEFDSDEEKNDNDDLEEDKNDNDDEDSDSDNESTNDDEIDEENDDETIQDDENIKQSSLISKIRADDSDDDGNSDSDDDDNSDYDDNDDDDENCLQKFNETTKKNMISEYHPEMMEHNESEIELMTTVVRNSNGVIIDDLHRSIPFVTKYEKARIIGERTRQLNSGATPFVEVEPDIIDGYLIAVNEFNKKKIPFIVKRPLPSGKCEYWKLSDLEIM